MTGKPKAFQFWQEIVLTLALGVSTGLTMAFGIINAMWLETEYFSKIAPAAIN
jgi:cyd operon protein YbgT